MKVATEGTPLGMRRGIRNGVRVRWPSWALIPNRRIDPRQFGRSAWDRGPGERCAENLKAELCRRSLLRPFTCASGLNDTLSCLGRHADPGRLQLRSGERIAEERSPPKLTQLSRQSNASIFSGTASIPAPSLRAILSLLSWAKKPVVPTPEEMFAFPRANSSGRRNRVVVG